MLVRAVRAAAERMKPAVVFATLVLGAVSLVGAATITLKNGDRVTGDILTSDDATVTVKTESMGEIKIKREAIAGINSEEPLVVTLADGRKAEGTVASKNQAVVVTPAQGPEVRANVGDLRALRTEAAEAAYEREQTRLKNPPFFDFWVLNAGLGLALTRGNSTTSTLNTNANISRTTGYDKITLYFTQLYATQSTTEPYGKTANRVSGGARYDRNFGKRGFAFGTTDFDYDEFIDLDLRSVFGGGLGVHILKTDRNVLDFGAGFTWNREAFGDGLVRNSAEALISESSDHKINSVLRLYQHSQVYPNLTDRGQYRMNFEGGVGVKLTKFMDLNTSFVDRYLSNPVDAKQSNDMMFTTGVGFTFAQK